LFRLGIILLDFIFIMILVVNPIVGKEKKKRKNISLT